MPDIMVDGQRIRYRVAGQGPQVVLLHCSSSHSGQWRALTEALADRFRVVAPDLHGYGESDPLPQDGRPYFDRDTAIIDALIGTGADPVHLVGHSMGGTLALRAALARPDRVVSVTVIEPVQFSVLVETGAPVRLEYHEIADTVGALVRLRRPDLAARHFVDFWVAPGAFEAMDPAGRDYVIATMGRVCDDWAGAVLDAPGQLRLADFARLAVPCKLLCGDRTRPSARAIVELLAGVIPGAELEILPGAGHLAAATSPEAVNPAIIRFLDRMNGDRAGF